VSRLACSLFAIRSNPGHAVKLSAIVAGKTASFAPVPPRSASARRYSAASGAETVPRSVLPVEARHCPAT
jgi:hypothetical protein